MEKIELQIKQDEKTTKYIAIELEIESNISSATKEHFIQNLIGKVFLVQPKMLNVADWMFLQYKKELEESSQKIKT